VRNAIDVTSLHVMYQSTLACSLTKVEWW